MDFSAGLWQLIVVTTWYTQNPRGLIAAASNALITAFAAGSRWRSRPWRWWSREIKKKSVMMWPVLCTCACDHHQSGRCVGAKRFLRSSLSDTGIWSFDSLPNRHLYPPINPHAEWGGHRHSRPCHHGDGPTHDKLITASAIRLCLYCRLTAFSLRLFPDGQRIQYLGIWCDAATTVDRLQLHFKGKKKKQETG